MCNFFNGKGFYLLAIHKNFTVIKKGQLIEDGLDQSGFPNAVIPDQQTYIAQCKLGTDAFD